MDYSSPLLYSRYFPKLREAAVEGLELQVAVLLRQYQPGSVIKSHYNCFYCTLEKAFNNGDPCLSSKCPLSLMPIASKQIWIYASLYISKKTFSSDQSRLINYWCFISRLSQWKWLSNLVIYSPIMKKVWLKETFNIVQLWPHVCNVEPIFILCFITDTCSTWLAAPGSFVFSLIWFLFESVFKSNKNQISDC